MIKIENVDVYGWEATIRGARNPMNSWDKTDSYECRSTGGCLCENANYGTNGDFCHGITLGENDLKLLRSLANAGPDHGKFLRMITVTMDITTHQVWWAEFDTYKVGTVRNSCSKMHKIHVKPFTIDDFSHEGCDEVPWARVALDHVITACEELRLKFNETQDKKYWRALIELLPEGYNMRATVSLNYQVLRNMYHARKHHKLSEWRTFCDFITTLPYAENLIVGST